MRFKHREGHSSSGLHGNRSLRDQSTTTTTTTTTTITTTAVAWYPEYPPLLLLLLYVHQLAERPT